ncbi:transporter family protein [Altererythrobacter lutimaris]|uniref:Transporter n=1 Tax=Altererythrobacter lutimaris TaxID=2743979 RepID=A0A850HAG3_9SPHN|nr:transporter [Altererythrobacter lutimaris]NVE94480.1 transporter [Altererythrobacter lutimaris]
MKTVNWAAGSAAFALGCAAISAPANAHEVDALDHAPIGVMGDHRHGEGEWMISYRLMHMDMGGVQIGNDDVDPDTVATTIPNRFAGMPMQPPTLRIVPTEMRMDMHMAGVMYGLSDSVTLMVMANYVTKEMDHITYQGGMGTTLLGNFQTSPAGFGDTKFSALIGLSDDVHFNAGISSPTGSISKTDDILTPMGGTPTVRLPYPMQLGSGTWDLEPGLTYRRQTKDWGWGAQIKGVIRLGDNDAGYAHGDKAMATAWLAHSITQGVAFSGRLQAETKGSIDGIDPQIIGPVQTANPEFHGGESLTAFAGLNFVAAHGPLATWRLGVELGVPVVQDLNGPQMPTDWTFTIGLQKSL